MAKKLNAETKLLIEDMVLNNESDEAIAKKIGKTAQTVQKIRLNLGISRKSHQFDTPAAANIPKDMAEKVQRWRMNFKSNPRYARLKTKLMPDDLEFFTDQWSLYHAQLEDMETSEEDQLEVLIILQIRINENQKSFKALQENESRLTAMLSGSNIQELDLENESDRFMFEMIQSNNSMKTQINKELKELSDRYDRILQTLNATRQQREEKQNIGGDTFLSLIRQMRDAEFRRKVGEYNERMKIATEKQLRKLKTPFTFKDGEVEPIYMDGKDFIK